MSSEQRKDPEVIPGWQPPTRSGGLRPGHRDVYPGSDEPTFTPEPTHPSDPSGNIPIRPKRQNGKKNRKEPEP